MYVYTEHNKISVTLLSYYNNLSNSAFIGIDPNEGQFISYRVSEVAGRTDLLIKDSGRPRN